MSSIRSLDIQHEVEIKASRARVFRAITEEMAMWCGPPYVHSELSQNLTMEPYVGGKFTEVLPGQGQGYLWGTVSAFVKDSRLELIGPLGMPGMVTARVSYELNDTANGCLLKLNHKAMGLITDDLLSAFTFGWRELLNRRLKSFVEDGIVTGLRKINGELT